MTFVAMLISIACMAASLERLRRVHRMVGFDLMALSAALGGKIDVDDVRKIKDSMLAERSAWEGELIAAALDARDVAERTAVMNEQLGDVESDLAWGSRIPAVAARLSAMGALCALFFALSWGGVVPTDIVPLVAWGGTGLVGSLAIGRQADRVAAEARRGVDVFVGRLTRVLDTAAGRGDVGAASSGGGEPVTGRNSAE